MTKTATSRTKTAKKPIPIAVLPRKLIKKRNSMMVAAQQRGESVPKIAKRAKISTVRAYSILKKAKMDAALLSKAEKPQKTAAVVSASPVGRAQTLLVQLAVLKEAVRNSLSSPKAKFRPKLGDEILGALASARTAEIAVKEASARLDAVRRRLEGRVASGKMNGVDIGWKAVARAAQIKSAKRR